MEVRTSKEDVIWSYVAQVLSITSGLITLPLILVKLSTEEIAINYLMLTIGTMVALIDFGFAPQFGKNITYVFSGAQELSKEGFCNNLKNEINYKLLNCIIDVAKRVYLYMSLFVFIVMTTLGTIYIYNVGGKTNHINNLFLIWGIFCVSTFFNIYFYYYSSLLTGRGYVKESKIALIATKSFYIVCAYVFLLCDLGLLGLCITNLVTPFVGRWISYHFFYDESLKKELNKQQSTQSERTAVFYIIWHNGKKLGLNFLGSYAIVKFSLFIAGLYLSMDEISSYGLMMQIVSVISAMSMTFFNSCIPHLTSLRISDEQNVFIKNFSLSLSVYWVVFTISSLVLSIGGPWILGIIGSNARLPSPTILVLYLVITSLENNHGIFATIISLGNRVPFVKSAIISGFIICIGDYVVLKFTGMGLLGVILVQGSIQLLYNNWYWPLYACRELKISPWLFTKYSLIGSYNVLGKFVRKLY